MVGLSNTLSLVAAGIVFTTILGIAAGVASFSTNWLLYKLSRVYVGLVRNVPLLLQLFFWYFAIYGTLPRPKIRLIFWVSATSTTGESIFPGPAAQNWLCSVLPQSLLGL
jgi:His/Glu/Gln/Arg/opine family amino acid ABC transporter permease subunit